MEWKGMECHGMEWNGMNGMERNGMEWNGVHGLESFSQKCSQIGAPGPPKSIPEVPRGTQIRFRAHFEQQVGLPWPVWAAIGTH